MEIRDQDGTLLMKTEAATIQTTHAPGCWSWGPRHYLCAYDRIKELLDEVRMLQEQNIELDHKLADKP